jgi:hypothetical protein
MDGMSITKRKDRCVRLAQHPVALKEKIGTGRVSDRLSFTGAQCLNSRVDFRTVPLPFRRRCHQ